MEDEIAAQGAQPAATRAIICRSRRSHRPRRSRHRQPADLALDHRAVARGRRSGQPRHQDRPGAGQRSATAARRPTGSPPKSATARTPRWPASSAATKLQLVLADDLIARIVVHSSRQSGLSAVYSELLDFDGCEIYTIEQPAIAGLELRRRDDGLRHLDADRPHRQRRARSISIRRWTPSIRARHEGHHHRRGRQHHRGRPPVRSMSITPRSRCTARRRAAPERTLLLGWNRRGPMIAFELSRYVAPGIAAHHRRRYARAAGRGRSADDLRAATCRSNTASSTPRAARRSKALDIPSLRPRAGAGLFRPSRRAGRPTPARW